MLRDVPAMYLICDFAMLQCWHGSCEAINTKYVGTVLAKSRVSNITTPILSMLARFLRDLKISICYTTMSDITTKIN